ncbi:MAG: NUDIX hydrolase [Deltaproteobacteria bacterium]|nr:NUDIX hydrolase [Deltaproteobacteria bacterium]
MRKPSTRWHRSGTTRVGEYGVFDVLRHEIHREIHEGIHPEIHRKRDERKRTIHTLETPQEWCNVVATTPDDHLIMVRLQRFGIDAPSLEIPGGLIDPGEQPIDAARRELAEESGYSARELVPLTVVHANPAIQPTRLHVFLATGCTPRPEGQQLDELEDCELVLVPLAELDDRLRRGDVVA